MSIVTFWNNGKEQTGKTLSLAAICTYLAMDHNYRILVIGTGYNDENLDNCYWTSNKKQKKSRTFWTKYWFSNGRRNCRFNKNNEK